MWTCGSICTPQIQNQEKKLLCMYVLNVQYTHTTISIDILLVWGHDSTHTLPLLTLAKFVTIWPVINIHCYNKFDQITRWTDLYGWWLNSTSVSTSTHIWNKGNNAKINLHLYCVYVWYSLRVHTHVHQLMIKHWNICTQ